MMPPSWIILYTFFIIILLIFSFINYDSFILLPSHEKKLSSKSMNWKW